MMLLIYCSDDVAYIVDIYCGFYAGNIKKQQKKKNVRLLCYVDAHGKGHIAPLPCGSTRQRRHASLGCASWHHAALLARALPCGWEGSHTAKFSSLPCGWEGGRTAQEGRTATTRRTATFSLTANTNPHGNEEPHGNVQPARHSMSSRQREALPCWF